MNAYRVWLLIFLLAGPGLAAHAGTAQIKKVLPHFIDKEGRHMLSPSLYERDAYQAHLRANPELRSGLRFDVNWKARGFSRLTLRIEMRGTRENQNTRAQLERAVAPRAFHPWADLTLAGEDYRKFGELVAWRATLWDGDVLVAEHKSFLW